MKLIKHLLPIILFLTLLNYNNEFFNNTKANTNPANILILLDGSGSMNDLIGKRSKIDIAKEVITKLFNEIASKSPDTKVGLRVYGHQFAAKLKNCQDTKLEIPIGKINQSVFQNKLKAVKPKGYTPIAYSLNMAIKDFPKNENNYIILVTDGEETCNGNISQIADNLAQAGIVVNVVGYKITG